MPSAVVMLGAYEGLIAHQRHLASSYESERATLRAIEAERACQQLSKLIVEDNKRALERHKAALDSYGREPVAA